MFIIGDKQLHHPFDKEPLLREEGDESGGEDSTLEMLKSCSMKSSMSLYENKIRHLPKSVFLVMGVFCFAICFGVDQYRQSMRECTDVLADCSHIPFSQILVPPFYNYVELFAITKTRDISLCVLPKVMSTTGTATLCYINDPEKFTADNRTISTEKYHTRFCKNSPVFSYSMVKHQLSKNFDNIIITRDPYDRFISGFTDKCVNDIAKNFCHGCGTDMRCFLRKEYRQLMRISSTSKYTTADVHFAPQTWYCDMQNNLKNSTVIRFSLKGIEKEKMIDDMLNLFRKKKVAERHLDVVREQLSLGKSHHTTTGTSLREEYERIVREDGSIRRALQRIYYYDFLLLGYDM